MSKQDMLTSDFARALKEARARRGLTQAQVAERYGIPKRTIENWESGDRTPPDYVQHLVIDALERDDKGV